MVKSLPFPFVGNRFTQLPDPLRSIREKQGLSGQDPLPPAEVLAEEREDYQTLAVQRAAALIERQRSLQSQVAAVAQVAAHAVAITATPTGVGIVPPEIDQAVRLTPPPLLQVVLPSVGVVARRRTLPLTTCGNVDGDDRTLDLLSVGAVGEANFTLSVTTQARVVAGLIELISFRWATDAALPEWQTLDTEHGITVGEKRVLAIRVVNRGVTAVTAALALQASQNFTTWTAIGSNDFSFTTPTAFPKADNAAVPTYEFQTNPAGTAETAGYFDANGTPPAFTLPALSETELWFCLTPTAGAGAKYTFRLQPAGTLDGIKVNALQQQFWVEIL